MLKNFTKTGFTIVELMVVITVISILAALVINSFSGAQARARDTERQSDIDVLASHLESFYKDKGYYPTFTDLSSNTWIKANLKAFDLEAVRVPRYEGSTNSLVNSASPTIDQYGYLVFNRNDEACTGAGNDCGARFELYWQPEKTSGVHEKRSLN